MYNTYCKYNYYFSMEHWTWKTIWALCLLFLIHLRNIHRNILIRPKIVKNVFCIKKFDNIRMWTFQMFKNGIIGLFSIIKLYYNCFYDIYTVISLCEFIKQIIWIIQFLIQHVLQIVANKFYLNFYIEMFPRNLLKFQDFSSSTLFMLTNTRYLIYVLIHYKLKKSKLISNLICLQ